MLQAREREELLKRWLHYGGDTALASYSPLADEGRLIECPMRTGSSWTSNCDAGTRRRRTSLFTRTPIRTAPCPQQPDLMLYREHFEDTPPHESGKIMVCGHTPQKSGIPRSIGHAVLLIPGPAAKGGSPVWASVRENTGKPASAGRRAAGGCLRQSRALRSRRRERETSASDSTIDLNCHAILLTGDRWLWTLA
jgi:hypothetical protein